MFSGLLNATIERHVLTGKHLQKLVIPTFWRQRVAEQQRFILEVTSRSESEAGWSPRVAFEPGTLADSTVASHDGRDHLEADDSLLRSVDGEAIPSNGSAPGIMLVLAKSIIWSRGAIPDSPSLALTEALQRQSDQISGLPETRLRAEAKTIPIPGVRV